MWKFISCFTSIFAVALAAGEFMVLSHPKTLVFKGQESLEQSILKDVYSAAVGFTVDQDASWSVMYVTNPFFLAKTIVTVVVEGVNDIGLDFGLHFPLTTNENEKTTFNSLTDRIKIRYPEEENNLVRIDLTDEISKVKSNKVFKNIKITPISGYKHLKALDDGVFLNEMTLLNSISNVISNTKRDLNVPNVYWFVVNGLHSVSDIHGSNSTQTIEAKRMLIDTMISLQKAFENYDPNRVFMNVILSDSIHTRRTRSVDSKASVDEKIDYNLAQTYSSDYPVIFNIILWFGIIMFFSLLAICIFIADMDPGRDSIIYRMTSNRMKKDN